MNPRVLVTGITGQDGWYLTELLARKGYGIHGVVRDLESEAIGPFRAAFPAAHLHQIDLVDLRSVVRLIDEVRPREVYNLAAPSFIPTSWQQPVETADLTALGPVRLLEAIRQVDSTIRFCQAGSREMFGAADGPQNEQSPCAPVTPYGAAKSYAHWMTGIYRRHHGLFACDAILFNHESPRRGTRFVTRKITLAAARIKLGLQDKLVLGDLNSQRDWGFAGDVVHAMWLMLQQPAADDFVIATGKPHTIRDVAVVAFGRLGLDWQPYVEENEQSGHPGPQGRAYGDSGKARRQLGWQAETSFERLIEMMVEADLAQAAQAHAAAAAEVRHG
jgi:GDPmannose 4,6-dehydratase